MSEWEFDARIVLSGHATVEADDADEAQRKFDAGDFEFSRRTSEMIDWEATDGPVEV